MPKCSSIFQNEDEMSMGDLERKHGLRGTEGGQDGAGGGRAH